MRTTKRDQHHDRDRGHDDPQHERPVRWRVAYEERTPDRDPTSTTTEQHRRRRPAGTARAPATTATSARAERPRAHERARRVLEEPARRGATVGRARPDAEPGGARRGHGARRPGGAGDRAGEPAADLERRRHGRGPRPVGLDGGEVDERPGASARAARPGARADARPRRRPRTPRRSTTTSERAGAAGLRARATMTVPVRAVAGQCTSRIGSPSTYSRTPRVTSCRVAAGGGPCASRSAPLRRGRAGTRHARRGRDLDGSSRGGTGSGAASRRARAGSRCGPRRRAASNTPRRVGVDDDRRPTAGGRRRGSSRAAPSGATAHPQRRRARPVSSTLDRRGRPPTVASVRRRTPATDPGEGDAGPDRADDEHRDDAAEDDDVPAGAGRAGDDVERAADEREDDARPAEARRSRQPRPHGWEPGRRRRARRGTPAASRSVGRVAQHEPVREHRDREPLDVVGDDVAAAGEHAWACAAWSSARLARGLAPIATSGLVAGRVRRSRSRSRRPRARSGSGARSRSRRRARPGR